MYCPPRLHWTFVNVPQDKFVKIGEHEILMMSSYEKWVILDVKNKARKEVTGTPLTEKTLGDTDIKLDDTAREIISDYINDVTSSSSHLPEGIVIKSKNIDPLNACSIITPQDPDYVLGYLWTYQAYVHSLEQTGSTVYQDKFSEQEYPSIWTVYAEKQVIGKFMSRIRPYIMQSEDQYYILVQRYDMGIDVYTFSKS